MKIYFKSFSICIVFFASLNAGATKMAPVSLEELMRDSLAVAIVDVKQANVSANTYKIVYSGEEKHYLNYVATVVDPIKGAEVGKSIEFSSHEPLLISRQYLVFLGSSKPGELLVAQAGYAAFEKAYISFDAGIKEGLRIPSSFISLPKGIALTPDVTKLNEQSSYVWTEWLPFKEWQIKHLGAVPKKNKLDLPAQK